MDSAAGNAPLQSASHTYMQALCKHAHDGSLCMRLGLRRLLLTQACHQERALMHALVGFLELNKSQAQAFIESKINQIEICFWSSVWNLSTPNCLQTRLGRSTAFTSRAK